MRVKDLRLCSCRVVVCREVFNVDDKCNYIYIYRVTFYVRHGLFNH